MSKFNGRAALLLSCLFIFSRSILSANADTPREVIARSRYWKLLLHYRPKLFGGLKSEAGAKEFFLSPDGRRDSLAELNADIKGFEEGKPLIGNLKQHPQCAFPERYRYLTQELELKIKPASCEKFQNWKTQLNPESATLIFASAYLNNPASMFGHTFLRINSKKPVQREKKSELLNYGVSYGANTGSDGGLLFAIYGLIGAYPGYFSLLPYFQKVNEYNNGESRDLWEYDLVLSADQISRMVNHLWELGSTHFDYYFFNKNCSYYLLELLEVANPEWKLTDKFFFQVIPADTVRAVSRIPGTVERVRLRPAARKVLMRRLRNLGGESQAQYEKNRAAVLSADLKGLSFEGDTSGEALDALLDLQSYSLARKNALPNEAERSMQRALLVARSKAPENKSPQIKLNERNRPDFGHETAKFSLYGGYRASHPGESDYYGIQLRLSYHDLLDNDDGYAPYSEIVLGRIDARIFRQTRKIRLKDFDLASIVSLAPLDGVTKTISWNLKAGLYSPPDLYCNDCYAGRAAAGVGFSKYLRGNAEDENASALGFAFLNANIEYSGFYSNAFRAGPSMKLGLVAEPFRRAKILVETEAFYFPNQRSTGKLPVRNDVGLSYGFSSRLELRSKSSYVINRQENYFEQMGMLSWYF